ncbi:MAG: hypothetical protein ACI4A3_07270 [Lachnospiraceae bacterium]
MCKAVEEMRKNSREEGKQEIVQNMLAKNLSPEEIADLTGVSLEMVLQIADKMK